MSEITGRNVGKTCRTHYRGTFNDGTQFDSSYDRGEPLEFVCGAGQMIKGFDAAVADMEVGEVKEIHLMPEEAYGMPDPNAILELEIAKLPGSDVYKRQVSFFYPFRGFAASTFGACFLWDTIQLLPPAPVHIQ